MQAEIDEGYAKVDAFIAEKLQAQFDSSQQTESESEITIVPSDSEVVAPSLDLITEEVINDAVTNLRATLEAGIESASFESEGALKSTSTPQINNDIDAAIEEKKSVLLDELEETQTIEEMTDKMVEDATANLRTVLDTAITSAVPGESSDSLQKAPLEEEKESIQVEKEVANGNVTSEQLPTEDLQQEENVRNTTAEESKV